MKRSGLLMLALACLISRVEADEPRDFTQQQFPFFETKIRPVLVEPHRRARAVVKEILA